MRSDFPSIPWGQEEPPLYSAIRLLRSIVPPEMRSIQYPGWDFLDLPTPPPPLPPIVKKYKDAWDNLQAAIDAVAKARVTNVAERIAALDKARAEMDALMQEVFDAARKASSGQS